MQAARRLFCTFTGQSQRLQCLMMLALITKHNVQPLSTSFSLVSPVNMSTLVHTDNNVRRLYLETGEGDQGLVVSLNQWSKEELEVAALLGLQRQGVWAHQVIRAIGKVEGKGVMQGVPDGHLQRHSLAHCG